MKPHSKQPKVTKMSDTLALPESLTIHTIENTYNELHAALSTSGDQVILDAGQIETLDTSGLQALIVLLQTAQTQQKSVTWANVNDTLRLAADKLGLTQALNLA
jgi:anti-anti-sigma regulatory factor